MRTLKEELLKLRKQFKHTCIGISKILETPERKIGIRCEKRVSSFGETCKTHQGMEINEWLIKVLAPDVILVKAKLNPNWFEKLKKEDSFVIKKTIEDIEKQREIQRLSSQFWRGNSCIHDGIEVFFNGVENVEIKDLINEIQDEGYYFSNLYFEERYWEVMKNVVVVFSRDEKNHFSMPTEIENFLYNCSWGFAHIFVNPPQLKNGRWRLLHSVHLAHRQPKSEPTIRLKFENGLWNFV